MNIMADTAPGFPKGLSTFFLAVKAALYCKKIEGREDNLLLA